MPQSTPQPQESTNQQPKLSRYLGVGLYSLSGAIGEFITAFKGMMQLFGNVFAAIVMATLIGVFSSLSSYFFQGKVILETDSEDKVTNETNDNNSDNDDSESAIININDNDSENSPLLINDQPKKSASSYQSIGAQTAYLTGNSLRTFFNRLFIINALLWLFGLSLSLELLLPLVLFTFSIKLLFVMTNEGYEGAETIAENFGNQTKPMYANVVVKPMANYPILGKTVTETGIGDHLVFDDMAGFILATTPKVLIDYLYTEPSIAIVVGSIAAVVGIIKP